MVFNLFDGLDWYDVSSRTLLSTTLFDIESHRYTDVILVDDNTAILGHSSGAIIIAVYDANMSRVVRQIPCLESLDRQYRLFLS